MVRCLFAMLFVCFLLPATAEASYHSVQHRQYQVARQIRITYGVRFTHGGGEWAERQRAPAPQNYHVGYGHVSGSCAIAAAKGGSCGCEAMKLTGLTDQRYWLVSNWRVFPRTGPHVGAAALWGNQHVEIVTAVNGDGTVNTAGSVGHSHVKVAYLNFVDPHAGVATAPTPGERAATPVRQSRYVISAPNRYRYASAFRWHERRTTFMRSPNRGVPQNIGWVNDYSQGRSL
jgi:hypothetical protein